MPSLPNLPVPGLSRTDEDPSPDELMRIYLRRHLAAAGAGAALFRRVASSVAPDMRMRVAELARDVEEDQQSLLTISERYGTERPVIQEKVGAIAQELGRLNPPGTAIRRSPLADVIELEALGTAVQGKLLGFRTLRALADDDPRLDPAEADALCERAQDQKERIEALRLEAVQRAMD